MQLNVIKQNELAWTAHLAL